MFLDWIEAIAAAAGAIFGGIALYLSYQANQVSQKLREDSIRQAAESQRLELERDRHMRMRDAQIDEHQRALDKELREREAKRDQREEDRERRSMAASVQAWWMCSDDKKTWGVAVSNSTTGAVFRDLIIHLDGNIHSNDLKMEIVPPGQFFVETAPHGNPKVPWELPRPLTSHTNELRPITRGRKKRIKSISFVDQLNTRWLWTPQNGLTKESI